MIEIGWDVDHSARWGRPSSLYSGPVGFIIAELGLAFFFSFEVAIRCISHTSLWGILGDRGLLFDAILVLIMDVEVLVLPLLSTSYYMNIFSLLRVVRICRVAWFVRLMCVFPRLRMIVRGILHSIRSVFWTFGVMCIFGMVWAILFTSVYHQGNALDEGMEGKVEFHFGSIGKSLFTLVIVGTLLDSVGKVCDLIASSRQPYMLAPFIVFVMVTSVMMLNLLVAILGSVLEKISRGDQCLPNEDGKEAIVDILDMLDEHGDGHVTHSQYLSARQHPQVLRALQILEIKEQNFIMYADVLFRLKADGAQEGDLVALPLGDVVGALLKLRPGNFITALDLAALRKVLATDRALLARRLERLEETCLAAEGKHVEHGSQKAWRGLLHGANGAAPTGPCLLQSGSGCSLGLDECGSPPEASPSSTALSPVPPSTPGSRAGPARRIGPKTLVQLARTPSADIVGELLQRYGVPDLDKDGLSPDLLDDGLQKRLRQLEALAADFFDPCTPDPDVPARLSAPRGPAAAQPLPGEPPPLLE